MRRRARGLAHAGAAVALAGAAAPALAAVDLAALWDFRDPAGSEQRFRAALAQAQGDDALILQTQIARAQGLRGDWAAARETLRALEPALASAGPEARVRQRLEWGRTWVSAAHAPATRTPDAVAMARAAYGDALALARTARLDGLAIDALHMFAFLDTAPAEQERIAREALAIATGSSQPAARRWEASLQQNLGVALLDQGRAAEALATFEQALALRERDGSPASRHVAGWFVARALRALGRLDEALQRQLALAAALRAENRHDPYVHEELAHLYRALGQPDEADRHERLRTAGTP
jgi:tetratricopeptide (TPR) repeat protein